MSSKLKTSARETAAKDGRAPRDSGLHIATARSSAMDDSDGSGDSDDAIEEPDHVDTVLAQSVGNFDITAFPYMLPPGTVDVASGLFQPEQKRDFTALALKPDHNNRPLWIDGWGNIILESQHLLAPQAQDFLVTIAEPVSRPAFMHEYRLTTHSLYAAVSVGLNPHDIVHSLDRFVKNEVPANVVEYIMHCGRSYGKVKMVLRDNKYFVETLDLNVLQMLLKDPEIGPCRVHSAEKVAVNAPAVAGLAISGTKDAAGVREAEGLDRIARHPTSRDVRAALVDEDDDARDVAHAFQIKDDKVGTVAQRCLELHYPTLEEYDFRNDYLNADLEIDLRPGTQIRPYQEKSLSKMFGNGRAKSGIIVLPCGAGKTLVGVTAACTIKKGAVVLATSNMSAVQWRNEFLKWSNIDPDSIAIFSSDSENRSAITGNTGIIITTYSMVTNTRGRARESARMMQFLQSREWGLMILDEVHVVPAQMFRRVVGSLKSHAKLGLTATLLREDDKIEDLNFLIGPKLYEANWMELSQQGYIAMVECAEVWCPMPTEFYEKYIEVDARNRSLLCVMNPSKFQACQYLIRHHERRGDKIIVFSDNVYALEAYAKRLQKPFLYGGTGDAERQFFLDAFRNAPECSTLFLSKIGDTSIDLPEATCLIQISAQYGSRRQEAQRLGRILRAKRRSEEGFNAFFYSLVSKDTTEMAFSAKRQAFLVDQGYAFKVITRLKDIEDTPDLAFATPQAQSELLKTVLAEVESRQSKQEEEKESAGLAADENMFHGSDGRRSRKVKGKTPGSTKAKTGPRSAFFASLARENEKRRRLH